MLAVALAQIVSRSIFNVTLDWAEEIARMALVWSALLAAPYGYRSASHVAITVFIEALPPRLLIVVGIVVHLLVAWICAMFFVESLALVERGMTIVATAVPLRMAWVYAIVPISLAVLFLIACEAALVLLRGWRGRSIDKLQLVGVVPMMQQDQER